MGEIAKKSGEIGEAIAAKLLELMGWEPSIQNISIKCHNKSHLNDQGKQRSTHGEDRIFIYNSPFHDNHTEVVHISVKNVMGKPPAEVTLKTKFKEHVKELQQIIECAKNSPELNTIINAHKPKRNIVHSGLLIWLHNNLEDIECNLKTTLANAKLDSDVKFPIYLIDNSRASFILKVIDDIKRNIGNDEEIEFFYPPIGTAIQAEENPTGDFIPLEIIASDIIPNINRLNKSQSLTFYADQKFSTTTYTKLISYALQFGRGLILDIKIGTSDFNISQHQSDAEIARLNFSNRKEKIIPFSFNRSFLSLLEQRD